MRRSTFRTRRTGSYGRRLPLTGRASLKVRAISQCRLHKVLNLDYLGVYRSLQQSLKALFMIGGMLLGQPIRGWGLELSALAFGKLLLHPLMTLAMLAVMPNFDPQLQTAALLFACMPIFMLLPALAQKYNLARFCSAALVLATLLSFITLNSWLAALPDLMQWTNQGNFLKSLWL